MRSYCWEFLWSGNRGRRAVVSSATSWPNQFNAPQGHPEFAAEAADLSISYYDSSTSTYSWVSQFNWDSIEITGYTERITLPSDSGYVDSVRIVFDSISGEDVVVSLDPDTVFQAPAGDFHLDALWLNAFDMSVGPYGYEEIFPSQLNGSDTVTLSFPHVQVPANFHVFIGPSVSSTGISASFSLRGDSEDIVPRTEDNCRSTYIGVLPSNNQNYSGVIDSTIMPQGYTVPLYSNFYITVFVSNSSSSVASNDPSPIISVFPNPASTFLQIQGATGTSNVELLDLLGRTVLSAQMNGNGKLDLSQLLPGRYEAIVHGTNGVAIAPVIIQ